jgi:hypothetical protein
VATVDLGWVERAWGLRYAGWAWDINEVTIPHGTAVKKTAAKPSDTPWESVREDLLKTLNGPDAKAIKRKKFQNFVKETREELAKLPKE